MNSQEFSMGLIMPDKEFDLCCVYIPNSGLKVYDQPNGNPQGRIYLGESDSNNEFYEAHIKINGVNKSLEGTNFKMVGYEVMALEFIDLKSGYVMLNNSYWIAIEELKSKHLKLTSWMDYVITKKTEWYANKPGLNLREGPSTNYNKIITLKGDLFGITMTNETNGEWCKVNVNKYQNHPCNSDENIILNTYSGWIKLISEEGTPNIWNYAKGC